MAERPEAVRHMYAVGAMRPNYRPGSTMSANVEDRRGQPSGIPWPLEMMANAGFTYPADVYSRFTSPVAPKGNYSLPPGLEMLAPGGGTAVAQNSTEILRMNPPAYAADINARLMQAADAVAQMGGDAAAHVRAQVAATSAAAGQRVDAARAAVAQSMANAYEASRFSHSDPAKQADMRAAMRDGWHDGTTTSSPWANAAGVLASTYSYGSAGLPEGSGFNKRLPVNMGMAAEYVRDGIFGQTYAPGMREQTAGEYATLWRNGNASMIRAMAGAAYNHDLPMAGAVGAAIAREKASSAMLSAQSSYNSTRDAISSAYNSARAMPGNMARAAATNLATRMADYRGGFGDTHRDTYTERPFWGLANETRDLANMGYDATIGRAGRAISSTASQAANAVRTGVANAYGSARDSVVGTAMSLRDRAVSGAQGLYSGAVNGIHSGASAVRDSVASGFNSGMNAIGGAYQRARDAVFGGSEPQKFAGSLVANGPRVRSLVAGLGIGTAVGAMVPNAVRQMASDGYDMAASAGNTALDYGHKAMQTLYGLGVRGVQGVAHYGSLVGQDLKPISDAVGRGIENAKYYGALGLGHINNAIGSHNDVKGPAGANPGRSLMEHLGSLRDSLGLGTREATARQTSLPFMKGSGFGDAVGSALGEAAKTFLNSAAISGGLRFGFEAMAGAGKAVGDGAAYIGGKIMDGARWLGNKAVAGYHATSDAISRGYNALTGQAPQRGLPAGALAFAAMPGSFAAAGATIAGAYGEARQMASQGVDYFRSLPGRISNGIDMAKAGGAYAMGKLGQIAQGGPSLGMAGLRDRALQASAYMRPGETFMQGARNVANAGLPGLGRLGAAAGAGLASAGRAIGAGAMDTGRSALNAAYSGYKMAEPHLDRASAAIGRFTDPVTRPLNSMIGAGLTMANNGIDSLRGGIKSMASSGIDAIGGAYQRTRDALFGSANSEKQGAFPNIGKMIATGVGAGSLIPGAHMPGLGGALVRTAGAGALGYGLAGPPGAFAGAGVNLALEVVGNEGIQSAAKWAWNGASQLLSDAGTGLSNFGSSFTKAASGIAMPGANTAKQPFMGAMPMAGSRHPSMRAEAQSQVPAIARPEGPTVGRSAQVMMGQAAGNTGMFADRSAQAADARLAAGRAASSGQDPKAPKNSEEFYYAKNPVTGVMVKKRNPWATKRTAMKAFGHAPRLA